jgi:hypothetical protein
LKSLILRKEYGSFRMLHPPGEEGIVAGEGHVDSSLTTCQMWSWETGDINSQ